MVKLGRIKLPPPKTGPDSLVGSMQTILSKSGYITPERVREIAIAKDRQRRQADAQRAELFVRECGVWPKYATASLDDNEFPRTMLTGDEFARYTHVVDQLLLLMDHPQMLVLYGGNGPGKTHLASAAVLRFCQYGLAARFTTANDFFLALKSTFGEKGRTMEDVVLKFRRYELLAIDEIEVRSDSNWENQQLRDLLNARYSCALSTIIITNKSADEINGVNGQAYFSAAIRDRIREEGAMLHCDWPSLRGKK